jgi:hypothetical protein
MIGRLVAPPAAPGLIRPGTTHRAEHIATEDPGSDVFESLGGNIVIDAGFAFAGSVHALKDARVKEPVESLRPTHAERMIQILLYTSTEAINRN